MVVFPRDMGGLLMRLIGFSVVVSLALAATCANAAYLDIPLPLPPSLGGTGNANGPSASAYAFSTTGGPAVLTSANLAAPVVIVTGTLTSSTTLTLPLGLAGVWTFINETSGAYPLYVGVVGQAAPLAVPQGYARQISSDGTNASSPVAQAYALTTPTTTTTGDVPAWADVNGQSLTDFRLCDRHKRRLALPRERRLRLVGISDVQRRHEPAAGHRVDVDQRRHGHRSGLRGRRQWLGHRPLGLQLHFGLGHGVSARAGRADRLCAQLEGFRADVRG